MAADGWAAWARSMSSATIRPSGPVPSISARSTPRSRAIRRASGEALIRSPSLLGARPTAWLSDVSASALGSARSALAGAVLVGGVSPDEDCGPSPAVLMMVLVGGRERSLAEFRGMARAAGLEVQAAGRQPSGRFVVECRPSERTTGPLS